MESGFWNASNVPSVSQTLAWTPPCPSNSLLRFWIAMSTTLTSKTKQSLPSTLTGSLSSSTPIYRRTKMSRIPVLRVPSVTSSVHWTIFDRGNTKASWRNLSNELGKGLRQTHSNEKWNRLKCIGIVGRDKEDSSNKQTNTRLNQSKNGLLFDDDGETACQFCFFVCLIMLICLVLQSPGSESAFFFIPPFLPLTIVLGI